MLPPPINPLSAVRQTTAEVVRLARHVTINDQALARYAATLAATQATPAGWDDENHFRDHGPLTAQYLLVLDALNFCFWPAAEWGYNRLARQLKQATLADPAWLDATALASITPDALAARLDAKIPLLAERARLLREVGAALAARWQGQFTTMIEATDHAATRLVALITAEFPGFRDHAIYQGQQVFLYKRAQILAGDLWGSFGGQAWGRFDDIADLTMFADYRVPQLLREEGILHYGPRLAPLVDTGRQLDPGSEYEIELRAATIQAVERLRDRLAAQGRPLTALEIDWYLWQQAEARREQFKPHHRTLTIYY
jgi:hypothetical protein